MKTLCRILVVSALALSISGIPLMAQNQHEDQSNRDHHSEDHGQHYVRHNEWRKGSHISLSDWSRGEQIDWHAHHLRQPPRGYGWREVDGNYVLAAVTTGVIASVIIASQVH